MDVEILEGEMRYFRKQKPADPFAAFSGRYGVRLPKAETEEAHLAEGEFSEVSAPH